MNRSAILTITIAILAAARLADARIIHRYSFNDGTAKDSVGTVNGTLKGEGAKIADGKLTLKNTVSSGEATVSYLDFGASILPKGTSAMFMFWYTSKDAGSFSRLLNVSDKDGSEGKAFLYITPKTEGDNTRAAISATDTTDRVYVDNDHSDDDKPHMLTVVIDGAAKKLRVFIDGKEPTPATDLGPNTLDKVKPVHNWMGRSTFDADQGLNASIDEFRVYDTALTAEEITAAQKAGPDGK